MLCILHNSVFFVDQLELIDAKEHSTYGISISIVKGRIDNQAAALLSRESFDINSAQ